MVTLSRENLLLFGNELKVADYDCAHLVLKTVKSNVEAGWTADF